MAQIASALPSEPKIDVDVVGARKERLLARIENSRSLPTLGASIARVIQTASNDDEAINKLASFVLSDTGLTQKVLHLANTVYFRAGSQIPVTTVSRAILILGFETVKTCALALLLVEKLGNTTQVKQIRHELLHGLVASCVGREMVLQRSGYQDAEEAIVVALFKNLGQILVATYDHDLYEEISKFAEANKINENQAAMKLLGFDYYNFSCLVMNNWSLPDTLISALAPLPPGIPKPPKTRYDWIQQVAAFSADVATACQQKNPDKQRQLLNACQQHYGHALGVQGPRFTTLVETVIKESRALIHGVGVAWLETDSEITTASSSSTAKQDAFISNFSSANTDSTSTDSARATKTAESVPEEPLNSLSENDLGLPVELLMLDSDTNAPTPGVLLPSGKPENARELLLSSLQEVMQTLASSRPTINQIVMMVLEALYRSMGFRIALVCLKQPKPPLIMRARTALGENPEKILTDFRFEIMASDCKLPSDRETDLFSLALINDVDLMISDATENKIRKLLPSWHTTLLPDALSFIILPLVINKKPIGLFYADRAKTTPEGISPEETALIKSLKAQVLAAMRV